MRVEAKSGLRLRQFVTRLLLYLLRDRQLRLLSPRETVWFYAVALMTALLLLRSPVRVEAPDTPVFPVAAPESQGIPSLALEDLADAVRGYVAGDKIAGAEVLVITNRKTVLHEAIGWRDREDTIPAEGHTVFNIRVMTKPVTGTAAHMLIDERRLPPDPPPATHLPSFDN